MTLLASWVGVDTHGPGSIYIASDSRVSWGAAAHFDYGRKVYAFRSSPDLLGYCGDVLFPSMVLSQIVEMADSGLLFEPDATCEVRSKAITQKLICQFANYPHEVKGIAADSLEVLHASRDFTKSHFECSLLRWTRAQGWSRSTMDLPRHSSVLFVRGSGAAEFNHRFADYSKGSNAGTSRNVFHCFCDTLFNTKLPSVGGAPQLAGLLRKPRSTGIHYGIIVDGHRYLLGSRVDELSNFDRMEWRNELFEVCDGQTCKRKPNAQPQPNPYRQ